MKSGKIFLILLFLSLTTLNGCKPNELPDKDLGKDNSFKNPNQ
jgi:hypothetical protein